MRTAVGLVSVFLLSYEFLFALGQVGECKLEDEECFDKFKQADGKFKWDWVRSHHRDIVDNINTDGYFMVADIKGHQHNEYAMASKEFDLKSADSCLAFRYFMYDRHGCDVVRLTVKSTCGTNEKKILQESGSTDGWRLVTADLKGAKCTISFKAAQGLNKEGKVAVDDVIVYSEPCPSNGLSLPIAMECNFQSSFCYWKNEGEAPFVIADHSASSEFGPHYQFDRYTSKVRGKYMRTDTSTNQGRSYKLVSPLVRSREDSCMRFAVNMNGKDVNHLKVTLNGEIVVEEKGNKGVDWFEKSIDLPANQNNEIIFTVDPPETPKRGDVAIDNIIVQRGSCTSNFQLDKCAFAANSACRYENYQTPCEPTYTKESVNGETTDVLKMEHGKCERKSFYVSWDVKVKTPRQGCLSFDYRSKAAERQYRECWLEIHVVDKRSHRVETLKDGSPGDGKWKKFKQTLNLNLEYYTKIRMKGRMQKDHCEEFSLANMRLTSGPCFYDDI